MIAAKVAVLCPAGMVTLVIVRPPASTNVTKAVLLLDSVTGVPPAGAGPSSVTVPTDDVPPFTLVGFITTDATLGGRTVKLAFRVTPAYTAEIVTDVLAVTGVVLTVNVAVLEPAATTTLAGAVAAALLLLSVTVALTAATPVSVTVPVDVFPPASALGLRATEDKAGGFTVKLAEVLVTPR